MHILTHIHTHIIRYLFIDIYANLDIYIVIDKLLVHFTNTHMYIYKTIYDRVYTYWWLSIYILRIIWQNNLITSHKSVLKSSKLALLNLSSLPISKTMSNTLLIENYEAYSPLSER